MAWWERVRKKMQIQDQIRGNAPEFEDDPGSPVPFAAQRGATESRRRLQALITQSEPGLVPARAARTFWNLVGGTTATVSSDLYTAIRDLCNHQ
jgi:hypothetical protein